MKIAISLASFVFLSGNVHASNVNPTKITKVLVGPQYGNIVIIKVSNVDSALPDCQTNVNFNYAFDGTTDAGKMTLSVVLATYTTQKDVWIGGTHTCSVYSGIENLEYIVAL